MEEANKTNSKKRAFENITTFPVIQDSSYFKMRAFLKDLRPHFIELLRTPDYQNCKAASEIQKKMKLLMDQYKEMTGETVTLEKCKNVPPSQPLPSEVGLGGKPSDQGSMQRPETKPVVSGNVPEIQQPEEKQGSFVVGGSAFGWNFITFPAATTVYYGRTKEAFRLENIISH